MQRVLIFGKGKLYREKESYIRENFEIIGFLDNRAGDNENLDQDMGIPVYNPQEVFRYLEDDIKIVLMSYKYNSMWKQLRDMGVVGDRVLFGIMFPPYSENLEALFEMGKMTIDGKDIVYIDDQEGKEIIQNHHQLQKIADRCLRKRYKEKYPMIEAIANMDIEPSSRKFGLERGTAIDRFYIENFLEANKELIHGDCLEIAENTYTLKYGEEQVDNAYRLHLRGDNNAIKGNLETGEGIEENRYDCVIITQTLMFIFDIRKVAANIYKMLKKNGTALITVAGISQISRYDADLWGSYYGFHKDAMISLFEPLFGRENVKVESYGNVKTAVAMLYGMCREELTDSDFEVSDENYPLILSVVLRKR